MTYSFLKTLSCWQTTKFLYAQSNECKWEILFMIQFSDKDFFSLFSKENVKKILIIYQL